ncbi:MAG: hypothetical protein ABI321_20195 [Polyangia bacterium]
MKNLALLCTLALTACGTGLSTTPPPEHRPVAVACAATVEGGIACNSGGQPGASECATSSTCTEGTNGRCLAGRGPCYCAYDRCTTDSDCGAGKACACSGGAGNADDSNHCVVADCRTDGDCGKGQFCAPALDEQCGSYVGVTAYRCTTPHDRCRVDADCGNTDANSSFAYCNYSSELGYWACTSTVCAG